MISADLRAYFKQQLMGRIGQPVTLAEDGDRLRAFFFDGTLFFDLDAREVDQARVFGWATWIEQYFRSRRLI